MSFHKPGSDGGAAAKRGQSIPYEGSNNEAKMLSNHEWHRTGQVNRRTMVRVREGVQILVGIFIITCQNAFLVYNRPPIWSILTAIRTPPLTSSTDFVNDFTLKPFRELVLLNEDSKIILVPESVEMV